MHCCSVWAGPQISLWYWKPNHDTSYVGLWIQRFLGVRVLESPKGNQHSVYGVWLDFQALNKSWTWLVDKLHLWIFRSSPNRGRFWLQDTLVSSLCCKNSSDHRVKPSLATGIHRILHPQPTHPVPPQHPQRESHVCQAASVAFALPWLCWGNQNPVGLCWTGRGKDGS